MFVVAWILFSLIVGFIGSGRRIGFLGACFLSLILSPVIGLIITVISKSKLDEEMQIRQIELQKEQVELLKGKKPGSNQDNYTEELEKLASLRDRKVINEEEFQKLKTKLFQKYFGD